MILINKLNQLSKTSQSEQAHLVGVTIDPNTLETSFEGLKKKYSAYTVYWKENMTMKDVRKRKSYNSTHKQQELP